MSGEFITEPNLGGATITSTVPQSITLLSPQAVSVAASSSTNVGTTTTLANAGFLYVYIASLPSGVSASISINNNSVPLTAGLNVLPLPSGTNVGQITLSNNNSSSVSVILWALIMS